MTYYTILALLASIILIRLVIRGLFYRRENIFLKSLAKEIGCDYAKFIYGNGRIIGKYKNKEIEVGIYENLGFFVKWLREAMFLFSANTRKKLRNERLHGIKITVGETIEKPSRIQPKMILVGNHIFYVVKGQDWFLTFGLDNIKATVEALDRVINVAERLSK